MTDVITVDLGGVFGPEDVKPVVEPLGPGLGYAVHHADGTVTGTPKGLKTLAARRREKLLTEDVTSAKAFEDEPEFFIVTWGRDLRAMVRGQLVRAKDGAFLAKETELSGSEQFTAALLVLGVRDGDGQAAFSIEDVLAYDAEGEDAEFLGDLVTAVIAANPVMFPPDEKKIVTEPAD